MAILKSVPGIEYKRFENWRDFFDFVDDIKDSYLYDIWRGQGDNEWSLTSGLTRIYGGRVLFPTMQHHANTHLMRFKYMARGRIEYDEICDENDDEMWALAQHYGLKTPLLDFSYSPFVALFFATYHHILKENKTVSIWSLRDLSPLNQYAQSHNLPEITRFHPKQKKNSRLISQNALFIKVPLNYSIDDWIIKIVTKSNEYKNEKFAYKIDIEFKEYTIIDCITLLNRMNINCATLFPDIDGVSNFCNMAFNLPSYHKFN